MINRKGCVITTEDCQKGVCNKFYLCVHTRRVYYTSVGEFSVYIAQARAEKSIFSISLIYSSYFPAYLLQRLKRKHITATIMISAYSVQPCSFIYMGNYFVTVHTPFCAEERILSVVPSSM